MIADKTIDLLLDRQITRSRFASLILQGGMIGGIPIGQGKCKGVILSANHFSLYDTARQLDGFNGGFYYGDYKQQSKQFLINTNELNTDTNTRSTGIIPCNDLSEVWVRCDTPDSMLVTGIGAGLYTYRGQNTVNTINLPYYNLFGESSNPDTSSTKTNDVLPTNNWLITNEAGAAINTSLDAGAITPNLAEWAGSTVTAVAATMQIEIHILY